MSCECSGRGFTGRLRPWLPALGLLVLLGLLIQAELAVHAHFAGRPSAALAEWVQPEEGSPLPAAPCVRDASRRCILATVGVILAGDNPMGLTQEERQRALRGAAGLARGGRQLLWHQHRVLDGLDRAVVDRHLLGRSEAVQSLPPRFPPQWKDSIAFLHETWRPLAGDLLPAARAEAEAVPAGWSPAGEPRTTAAWQAVFGETVQVFSCDPFKAVEARQFACAAARGPVGRATPEEAARLLAHAEALGELSAGLEHRWIILYRTAVSERPHRETMAPIFTSSQDLPFDQFVEALEAVVRTASR